MSEESTYNNDMDNGVDKTLIECLNIENPKSFFLFAGAGSGKTRSLVNTLRETSRNFGRTMRLRNKQIAVITYTNAASDEIIERLRKETIDVSLFEVSTIHSFAWTIIQDYPSDIKEWLKIDIDQKIIKWEAEELKGKKGTKASKRRIKDIEKGKEKLKEIDNIRKFKYDPNGENTEKNLLQHEDVISICASFLKNKPLFQKIVAQKYPIILIDESQDTKKKLIEVFFELEEKMPNFSLGLFGDMMQRIYMDGKEDLAKIIPDTWEKPFKRMNHRSEKRIIDLINKIRHDIDGIEQKPRIEKKGGIVRLFIFPTSANKETLEAKVKQKMAEITNDALWLDSSTPNNVKTLILEHHMAAVRLGFINLFTSLNAVEKYRTSFKDGTLSSLNFFTKNIIPLVKAHREKNKLQISQLITSKSPLLNAEALKKHEGSQLDLLKGVNLKVQELLKLWESHSPVLNDILLCVYKSKLFNIPSPLLQIAEETATPSIEEKEERTTLNESITVEDAEENILKMEAWKNALKCSFEEVENYYTYISDATQFATHQGVKGLEFDRVVGILSDEEASGHSFSYEKLFEVKALSETDLENRKAKKDSSMERTKRLFYVICSRAKESLSLIAYTEDINKLKEIAIKNEWFSENEILFEKDLNANIDK